MLYLQRIENHVFKIFGSLTQLVQSVTSTTWKSLVRIQYGPQLSKPYQEIGRVFWILIFIVRNKAILTLCAYCPIAL